MSSGDDPNNPDEYLGEKYGPYLWQARLQDRQAIMCAEECTRRIREEGREDLSEGVYMLIEMRSNHIWQDKPWTTESGPPTTHDTPWDEKVAIGVVPIEKRDVVYAVLFEVLSIDPISERVERAKNLSDSWNRVYSEFQLKDIGMDRPNSRGVIFEIPGGLRLELIDDFVMRMYQYLEEGKELPTPSADPSR